MGRRLTSDALGATANDTEGDDVEEEEEEEEEEEAEAEEGGEAEKEVPRGVRLGRKRSEEQDVREVEVANHGGTLAEEPTGEGRGESEESMAEREEEEEEEGEGAETSDNIERDGSSDISKRG